MYVAKVQPFMKIKTDEGKEFYDLWFILEGRGANRGSVLQAKCKCKDGQGGGCQHTAAAMYTLEDLLNTRGKFIKLKLKFKFVFIHTYSHLDKIFLKYKEKRDGTF